MRTYDHDAYNDETGLRSEDEVIDEALGENPRARELRLMRGALEQKRDSFLRDRDRAQEDKERMSLGIKIAELNRQIATLKQEEGITTFVEDSVRVTMLRPDDY